MKKITIFILILTLVFGTVLMSACGVNGMSAYELAVSQGYKGTLDEWLASLQAETTDPGTTTPVIEVTGGDNVSAATSKALLSVVSVVSYFTRTGTGGALQEYGSSGSGVIFYEDDTYAYIVTNYHVVYDSKSTTGISDDLTVYLYGQFYSDFEIAAEYVGGSMTNDIAVIRIIKNERYVKSSCAPATVADSLTLHPGDTAIAIGNPNSEGLSVSSGIVSVVSEYITLLGADDMTSIQLRVVRIDTPVNHGNSGGGLFNGEGELIGIVNAKYESTDTDNIGYAIPSNIAISVAKRIVESGLKTIDKCLVGITMQVTDSYAVYNAELARTDIKQQITITDVTAGGAADGYLKIGDVLKSFSYKGKTIEVNTLYTIGDYIFGFKQFDDITFTVERDGQTLEVTLPLTNAVSAP